MIDDGPEPEPAAPQPLPDPFQTHAVAMVAHLDATRPWARFMAIVGFVVSGLLAAISLIVLLLAPFVDWGPFGPFLSLVYFLLAVVYVVPCLYLNRYASSIAQISRGGGPRAMAEALDHQRRFWRLVGILTIAMLCLYGAAIGVAIVAGVVSALAR